MPTIIPEKEIIQAEELYNNLMLAADGYTITMVTTTTAVFLAKLVTNQHTSEKGIKEQYNRFANAAIDLWKYDNNQLQAEEDAASKEEGATPKPKTRNVIKPPGFN